MPPSQACPAAMLSRAADRAILKCLEKDKNNRYPDVSALAVALQEVISGQSSELSALKQMQIPVSPNRAPVSAVDMLEPRRGDPPNVQAPAMPPSPMPSPRPQPSPPQALQAMPQALSPSPGLAMSGPPPGTPVPPLMPQIGRASCR